MLQPGRTFNPNSYRYGMMGFEKDDEIKGSGNHYSFGDMGYDPRLVRRWRPDPFEREYPNVSPYAFALNNPIYFIDKEGEIIVDREGNVVTVNEDGTYTFAENTSQKSIDAFYKNTKPVFEQLNASQLGRERMKELIESEYGFNVEDQGGRDRTANASIAYQVSESGVGFYSIDLTYGNSKTDAAEFYAVIIGLEKGHISQERNPDRAEAGYLDLEAKKLLKGGAKEYIGVYEGLLNQVIRDIYRYRTEEGKGNQLNKNLFYPIEDVNNLGDLKNKPNKLQYEPDTQGLKNKYGDTPDPNYPDD